MRKRAARFNAQRHELHDARQALHTGHVMITNLFVELARLARDETPCALGVLTRVTGSSPQKTGAKAVFLADGTILGTLGGGCLEAEIQDRARRALRRGTGETFELVLDHDFGWDDGLICGGKVQGVIVPGAERFGPLWKTLAQRATRQTWGVDATFGAVSGEALTDALYQESVEPPPVLWIAGAGHIAQAVTPLALRLDYDVVIFDDRPALVSHAVFPWATALRSGDWDTMLDEAFPEGRDVYGLIVTRGHRHDALVLRRWVGRPFRHLGMIGSRRKARTILDHFAAEGIATPEQLARVKSPVGLDLGAETVDEIALSICAELVQVRRGDVPAA
jgi:xanthine dehydrogenase accessory factor